MTLKGERGYFQFYSELFPRSIRKIPSYDSVFPKNPSVFVAFPYFLGCFLKEKTSTPIIWTKLSKGKFRATYHGSHRMHTNPKFEIIFVDWW